MLLSRILKEGGGDFGDFGAIWWGPGDFPPEKPVSKLRGPILLYDQQHVVLCFSWLSPYL